MSRRRGRKGSGTCFKTSQCIFIYCKQNDPPEVGGSEVIRGGIYHVAQSTPRRRQREIATNAGQPLPDCTAIALALARDCCCISIYSIPPTKAVNRICVWVVSISVLWHDVPSLERGGEKLKFSTEVERAEFYRLLNATAVGHSFPFGAWNYVVHMDDTGSRYYLQDGPVLIAA